MRSRSDIPIPEGARITVTDIRSDGHCARGIKKWFEARGYDFRVILKEGVDAREFWDTGDGYAQRVVKRKFRLL